MIAQSATREELIREVEDLRREIDTLKEEAAASAAEGGARESGVDLQTLLDSFPFLVWLKDTEGRFVAVNQPMAASCGLSGPERLVGKTDLDVWPRRLAEAYRADDSEVMATGAKKHVEELIVDGGVERWFETYKAPLSGAQGSVYGTAGFARDVTGRRRQQDALQQSETLLRTVLDSTADGILVVADGRVLAANRRFQALWRMPDDLVASGAEDRMLAHVRDQLRDPEGFERRVRELYRGEEEATDALELRDGRAFERFSRALRIGAQGARLWSFRDVTEEKKARHALERERARLSTLVKTIPDLVWLKDPDGVYLDCNPSFERLYGATKSEIVGKSDDDFVDFATADFFRRKDREAIDAGGPRVNEEWLTFACDGHRAFVETIKTPMLDGDGRLVGVLGIARDVTDKRRSEEALRESEARYRTLFESMSQGVFYQSAEGAIVDANPAALRLFGLTREEFLARTSHHPDWHVIRDDGSAYPADEHPSMVALATGRTVTDAVAGVFHPRLKHYVWLLINAVPEFRPGEATPYRVFVTLHDITERKKAEEARVQSEKTLRSLLEAARTVPWEYDVGENRITYMGPQVEALFGYSSDSWQGRDTWLERVHPEDRAWVEEHTCRERDALRDHEITYRALTADGRVIWIHDGVHVVRGEGGAVRLAGFMRDVTESKRLSEERVELEKRLRQSQKMEAIGTLAGGIAHDFNNILTPIMAHAELGLMQLDADSGVREDLTQILVAAERATALIRQILAISRREEEELTPIALGPLVKEVLKFLRASLPSTIEIRADIDPACGPVSGNLSQLHQVILNLCANAGDAMAGRGGTLTVSLEPFAEGCGKAKAPCVRLSVQDTGTGIPADLVDRIFEPYFTTKPRGKGTGLGLAVVHSIVTKLAGDIRVRAAPGGGSRFDVLLPAATLSQPPLRGAPQAVRPGRGEHVLVVDDEASVKTALERMLAMLGYRATAYAGPVEALNAVREASDAFDVVLTDQTMPGMTGLDLAAEIRTLRPGLPIVLGTGFSEAVNDETVAFLGLQGLIMKPYTVSKLSVALAKALASAPGG